MRRLAIFASAFVGVAVMAPSAFALPGDPGVFSADPFQLNNQTLEPGCFTRDGVDTHVDLTLPDSDEAHVTVRDGSRHSVDQVLVAAEDGGYRIYNTFDTGSNGSDDDIDPNQTATDLFAPGGGDIDRSDTILCVSDHAAPQNEPYQQEAGGLVSAKNRPIIQPEVTRLGVSAIEPLNTYRVGFGYSVERWYQAPSFDGASAFPAITDPLALPSGNGVVIPFRPDDFPYDARRVNDVDAPAEDFDGPDTNGGQNFVFSRDGDETAWLRDGGTSLLTTVTEGDFPIEWTLRPSLGAPSTERSVEYTAEDLAAWHNEWQAYYAGTGPRPEMKLAPGTNSPRPQQVTIVNPPESAPADPPAQAPAGNTTIVQAPVLTAAGGSCVSNKKVTLRFGKKVKSARISYAGGKASAKRSHGRMVAKLDFSGIVSQANADLSVVKITKRVKHGKKIVKVRDSRIYKLCG